MILLNTSGKRTYCRVLYKITCKGTISMAISMDSLRDQVKSSLRSQPILLSVDEYIKSFYTLEIME